MRELLPLLHDVHALRVDQPVAVDAPQADVRARLHVGGLFQVGARLCLKSSSLNQSSSIS